MEINDVLDPGCPLRQVLDRIGDKWSVQVVAVLGAGLRRFTELRDAIGGVTPKVLTQTLRGMERDGLLTRTVYAQVPLRVEYELTPLGRSLHTPLEAIHDWAEKHITEVKAARDAHDMARSPDHSRS